MDFYNLFYTFVIYAFFGWVVEVIYAFMKQKKFVNRGFLYGPFCPIYGCGAAVILTIIHYIPKDETGNLLKLFIYSVIITTLIEYITGVVLEKFFQAKWWDYSKEKFNLKGYICLKFSILWGALVLVVYKLVNPYLSNVTVNIQSKIGDILFYPLLVYFTIDFSLTLKSLIDFRRIVLEISKLAEELKLDLGTDMGDFKFVIKGNILELRRTIEDTQEQLKKRIEYSSGNIKDSVVKIKTNISSVKNTFTKKQYNQINKLLVKYEYLSNKLYYSRLYKKFPDLKSKRHKIFNKLKEVKKIIKKEV